MTYAPTNPIDVPPYQIQQLVDNITASPVHVTCAQALGSELYVGCSSGELIRFALHADVPNQLESYRILSRQTLASSKPIDEIVLIPSLSRALILTDRQLHFYVLPSLDPVPQNIIKPIRHVVTFAVDAQHLKRPPPAPSNSSVMGEPVEFCVIKRNAIAMYTLRDRLFYQKEIPLPQGATMARRTGHALCIADNEYYNMVDLEGTLLFQLLPLSQAPEPTPFVVQPHITVVGNNEFLILSWTGASTLGLFVTGDGDPVRGTLEWPSHPESVCLDYPYITTLLPNDTIEIHSIETQTIVQVIGAPPSDSENQTRRQRTALGASIGGYLVPSTQQSDKMRTVPLKLLRGE